MKRKILSASIGIFVYAFIFSHCLPRALAAESEFKRNMVIHSKVVVDKVKVGDYTKVDISAVRIANSNINGSLKINAMKSNVDKIIAKDNATVKVAAFDLKDTELNDAAQLSLSANVSGDISAGKSSTIMIGTFSTASSHQGSMNGSNSFNDSPYTNGQMPELTELPDSIHEYISEILGKILRGESVGLEDLMQLSELIDVGVYAYVGIEGGLGLGVSQLKVNLDVAGIQLKVTKKEDGTIVAEFAGRIGIVDAEGDASVGGGISAVLKGVEYIEISPDCRYISFGTKAGVEAGIEGRAMAGIAVIKYGGEGNISRDITTGYKITMPVDRYFQYMTQVDLIAVISSFFENNSALRNIPIKGLYYAYKYDDVSLYLTSTKGTTVSGGVGVKGGAYKVGGGELELVFGIEASIDEYNIEHLLI